jgi:hypothetical protein
VENELPIEKYLWAINRESNITLISEDHETHTPEARDITILVETANPPDEHLQDAYIPLAFVLRLCEQPGVEATMTINSNTIDFGEHEAAFKELATATAYLMAVGMTYFSRPETETTDSDE